MPTKARRNFVADNESNNDGSIHLKQCTATGPESKDCVAWTSIWLPKRKPRNFIDRPFLSGFCSALGLIECKTSSPSKNTDFTSLFCANLIEQYGRLDNISVFGVEQNFDEDVFERVVEVTNNIGVTISKQDISKCHCLP